MPRLYGREFSKKKLAEYVGDFSQIFGVDLLVAEDGIGWARLASGLMMDQIFYLK